MKTFLGFTTGVLIGSLVGAIAFTTLLLSSPTARRHLEELANE